MVMHGSEAELCLCGPGEKVLAEGGCGGNCVEESVKVKSNAGDNII